MRWKALEREGDDGRKLEARRKIKKKRKKKVYLMGIDGTLRKEQENEGWTV